MATSVNIHEAKTHFSKLLARVAAGEEIVIAKAGTPVARLVPDHSGTRGKRIPGIDKGKLWISPDFDTMSDADLEDWCGSRPR